MTEVSAPAKQTLCSIFLLPCLEIVGTVRAAFSLFGFVNCYAYCDLADYPFKSVFLLFEPKEFDSEFIKFLIALESNINYAETIDVPNGVVVGFKIPDKYLRDYGLFLNGRYSKLSKEFKSLFPLKYYLMDEFDLPVKDPATSKPVTERSMFYHIFNRTNELKETWYRKFGYDTELPYELFDKFSESKETLKYL